MAAIAGRLALGGLKRFGSRIGGRLANRFGRRPNLNDYPNVKYGLGKMGNSALSGAGTMAGGLAAKGIYNVLTGNGPIQRRRRRREAEAAYAAQKQRPRPPGRTSGSSGGACGCSCKAPPRKAKRCTTRKPKPRYRSCYSRRYTR